MSASAPIRIPHFLPNLKSKIRNLKFPCSSASSANTSSTTTSISMSKSTLTGRTERYLPRTTLFDIK